MSRIVHGGDIYSEENAGVIDFSANINPLGAPESVKRAIGKMAEHFSAYPDPLCRSLCGAISEYEGVPRTAVFCSNGASEIFYRIAWAFRPRKALVTAPAFSEYRQAVESAGGEAISYRLRPRNGFVLNVDYCNLPEDSVDMVFLCNPNNPTGVLTGRQTVKEIADRCRETGAILVVDECFMDFVRDGEPVYSAKPLLSEYDNIILVQAFTKIFAMAGVRLGYCLTYNPHLISRLEKCGQPWSVSSFAQAAGIAACNEKQFVLKTQAYVEKERDYLKAAFSALGFHQCDSRANYILFQTENVFNLKEKLLQKGLLIRSCANYEGLDGSYYRIAVRTHEENQKLVEAMEDLF